MQAEKVKCQFGGANDLSLDAAEMADGCKKCANLQQFLHLIHTPQNRVKRRGDL